MKRVFTTVKAEVLIIGAGGAGLRAALALNDAGVDALIIGKSKKRDAHTKLAAGGINAALATMDKHDTWKIHAADTLREGQFIGDSVLIEKLCKEAPRAIRELVDYGVPFHSEKDGRLTQRFFGAHTYRRTCFVGDHTGKDIINALTKEVDKRNIASRYDTYIFSLLKKRNRVIGALGFDFSKHTFIIFSAKAVIIATGGHSRVYKRSSSRLYENYGDGIYLSYDAGCELIDMEMVQFHPTGMIYPQESEGILVTEAVRGEGGILLNKHHERFMRKYDPTRMELSARDVVARAIYDEIQHHRGTPHGGVWLTIAHKSKKYIKERLPTMYKQFKEYAHLDISKHNMEVAPTAHYSMGGVRFNAHHYGTTVKGLYVIGEVTGGIHGANRLGGNSLAEIIVFGRLVGEKVARFVQHAQFYEPDHNQIENEIRTIKSFFNKGTYTPFDLRKEIHELMWKHAGIERNALLLRTGLQKIDKLKKKIQHIGIQPTSRTNDSFITALDVRCMIVACEAILRSALARTESRGAHYRNDFPRQDDKQWKVNIICKKERTKMNVYTKKAREPSAEIRNILRSNLSVEHHLLE